MSTDRIKGSPIPASRENDGAVDESQIGGRQVVSARRRLLGGVVAAPAVLALHSGSALAKTSANCVQKQADTNPKYPGSWPSSDTYVRVQLWWLKPSANSGDVTWYISGEDVAALAESARNATNGFLKRGQWLKFDPGMDRVTGSTLDSQPTLNGNNVVWERGPKWVALRFDSDSRTVYILGAVGDTADGTAIAGTCWASVKNLA